MHILIQKNHIKMVCSEIRVEIIFGWPTFEISTYSNDSHLGRRVGCIRHNVESRPTKNNFNSGVSEQKILMCFFLSASLEEGWDVSDIMLKVGQPKIISTRISGQTHPS
jgi:hypothetical protein